MMNNKFLILGVVGVGVLGVALWWFFTPKDASESAVVSNGAAASPEASPVELGKEAQEILNAVAIIASLNLDTEFFNDPRFIALKKTPIEVPPQKPTPRTFDIRPLGAPQQPSPLAAPKR